MSDGKPRYHHTRWTPDEDAYLRDHWDAMTIKDMALALGRTPDAVRSRGINVHGLRKRWSDADEAVLADAVRAAADEVGVSYADALSHCKAMCERVYVKRRALKRSETI